MTDREEKTRELIERLATNEEAVAGLYRAYADKFPTLSGFWAYLVTEETRHALWLRNLGSAGGGCLLVDTTRFNPVAVQTFTEYLAGEMKKLNARLVPLVEALSTTLYMEQSLIESRFFDVFKTDSTQLINTLNRIKDDTAAHRSRAKQELAKHKSGF